MLIRVYLKNYDTEIIIENERKVNSQEINRELNKDGFIRIYDYIFPCNDILFIKLEDRK